MIYARVVTALKSSYPLTYMGPLDDPEAYAQSHNEHRRHENPSQRALVGVKWKAYYAEKAKLRQSTSTGGSNPQLVELIPQAEMAIENIEESPIKPTEKRV